MPLYEYHCPSCDFTFEVLASLSGRQEKSACPECGRRAPRVVSSFAIARGANGDGGTRADNKPGPAKDARPLCLQHPHLPLLCHMDDKAARRWVAHAHGRGAEYDDTAAMREELRTKRGELPPKAQASDGSAADAHAHSHAHSYRRHPHQHGGAHSHGHDDSTRGADAPGAKGGGRRAGRAH